MLDIYNYQDICPYLQDISSLVRLGGLGRRLKQLVGNYNAIGFTAMAIQKRFYKMPRDQQVAELCGRGGIWRWWGKLSREWEVSKPSSSEGYSSSLFMSKLNATFSENPTSTPTACPSFTAIILTSCLCLPISYQNLKINSFVYLFPCLLLVFPTKIQVPGRQIL